MMDTLETESCPTCQQQANPIINWEYSGLGDSIFNYTANYYACNHCGLVYINNIDDDLLTRFYQEECSYYEKEHFNIHSAANIKKYQHYLQFIYESGLENQPLADIGCGRGGFINWLVDKGWEAECYGVDIDVKSIPLTEKHPSNLKFIEGKAVELPFEDASQSILSYFHVLEHICDIDSVLQEAKRVLSENGKIWVEVPDAERYHQYPVGTAFWFGIREHIYHFSECALVKAFNLNGFKVEKVSRQLLPTPEFNYPSLMLLASKESSGQLNQACNHTSMIKNYIQESNLQLKQQAKKLSAYSSEQLTFWGCSSELFSLLPLLSNCEFILCDSSLEKQKMHYQGKPIFEPKSVPQTGKLVVAPYLHQQSISRAAQDLGWGKSNIYKLQ